MNHSSMDLCESEQLKRDPFYGALWSLVSLQPQHSLSVLLLSLQLKHHPEESTYDQECTGAGHNPSTKSLLIRGGMNYLLRSSVLLFWWTGVAAHPQIFVDQAHCSTVLAVGRIVMGSSVVSGNSRSIIVKRNDKTLVSGDTYVANEILSVTLSSTTGIEFALQVTQGDAVFPGGGCSNKRRAMSGEIIMPSYGQVIINGGSASTYGTITMFDDFVLNCCNTSVVAGTPTPTKQDTAKPAVIATSVGIALPCFLFTVGVAFCCYYAGHSEVILAKTAALIKIPSYVAVAAAFSALILVLSWAQTQNGDSIDYHYIGTSNWQSNLFAYHPVLMVGGLFFGQVLAINDWNLLPFSHTSAKGLHVVFQTGAVVSMSVGLAAVMKVYVENHDPLFVTMHSWMGLGAVICMGFNYALGECILLFTYVALE